MPSKSLYKETLSEFGQVHVAKLTGKRRPRFALLYASILCRTDLKPCEKLTLMVLDMESRNADSIAVSHNAIARLAGISRTSALASIAALVEHGLIGPAGDPIKQVQPYRLIYKGMDRKTIPTIKCSECKHPCYAVNKAGYCRTCATRIEDDRLYAAALMVLGPGATPQQIALHHNTEKQAKRWIAARRRHELKAAGMARTA